MKKLNVQNNSREEYRSICWLPVVPWRWTDWFRQTHLPGLKLDKTCKWTHFNFRLKHVYCLSIFFFFIFFCPLFCLLFISLCVLTSFWVLGWDRSGSTKTIWQHVVFQTWICHPNQLKVFTPAWHGYTGMALRAWEGQCEGGYLTITASERKVFKIWLNKLTLMDFLEAGIDGGEGVRLRVQKPDVLNLCLRMIFFLNKLLTKLLWQWGWPK